MRYFVFLLLAAFNVSAFAAACKYYIMADGVTLTTSATDACESQLPDLRKQYPNLSVGFTGTFGSPPSRCDFKVTGSNGHVYEEPSSSLQYTTKECGDDDPCQGGKGTSQIVNITAGWKRTPKVNDPSEDWVYTYKLPPSGVANVCSGSNICQISIDASEPCAECGSYVSQTPGANGLHRVSVDFRGHYTGQTCSSTSSSDLPPEATQRDDMKDPPCPGFVGEVNGARGCYGTASKPINSVPPPPKPPGIGEPDAGNPAAGTKPSTGEGSGSGGAGRTPSAGTGGSGGGPSGAAAAGSGVIPDGTTPKPMDGKEQAACGAPGQPKCGIDESGTPTKFDGKGDLLGGWEEGVKANRATIEKSGTGIFDSFSVFFSAPPLAGCEPIELPHDQVITRHCDVVEGTRSVMAYIWALTALWLCVGWIREAI